MMYNCLALDEPIHQAHLYKTPLQGPIMNSTNKFVYIKKTCTSLSTELEPVKVLINPNFNKKVFVNPNFNSNRNITSTAPLKIHVNPNATNLRLGNINEYKNVNKIHVNPNVLKNVPFTIRSPVMQQSQNKNISDEKEMNRTVISTRTKLIRIKAKNATESKIRKRRLSVKSQFKVIKSSLVNKSDQSETEMKLKHKLLKPADKYINGPETKPLFNKFKVDNRTTKLASPKGKKYIYVNRFLSISDIAKNNLLKKHKNKLCVVNIGGILYKKSPNVLKKTSNSYPKLNNVKKTRENMTLKSKYNFVRNSVITSKSSSKLVKQPPVSKFGTTDTKNISQRRVCNIPCPYYRKFGRCKGKENGKCYRKHDPDQIALCTKFLQGACIDKKCLLSHNVSPEKMPTCKFYLEGSCSRDDCPYLHVRISPKAEVCKDFLEGFCRKAAECDKRHQFLCPDYEKNGSCLKQRCQYPHGKMVRKYSVFNQNKFAKKSSCDDGTTNVKIDCNAKGRNPKSNTVNIAENSEGNIKSRYYIGQNNLETEDGDQSPHTHQSDCIDQENDQCCGIKSRPKLGKLPSFIAFESS